ncbi:TIGR02680 family protein [Caldimonas tepidiphila]|uniref:TIGR02680 family protein n=1 Tax=Caldimonas tepidiphila TaxID=2315841 RepID=UPI000E5A441D|nr:TIGR02680 family protein [Caldimonas tepidiphila]
MNDPFDLRPLPETRPALPQPALARWQPLRLGLVELFHYDSEEFWFRDGHLLLRGNNGTGKSKVLSLTLPFLFDAQLKSSRIEPDGDAGKKMAWNLLMNSHDRRIGYAWIEFGRVGEDGAPRFLTLGAGLAAVAARPEVQAWFFVVDGRGEGPRLGRDLWLTTPQRAVLTREKLREVLQGHGQVFDTAAAYRRAVDERLFHLGEARYAALMDTLIQLRQPQLSKKPDEASLSRALTEALPPMSRELLGDVADALGQLEEDRRQLAEYEALEKAVNRFEQRYRVYARTLSRREARVLRQAQTEFDGASRALGEAQQALEAARQRDSQALARREQAERDLAGRRATLDTLQSDPAMQDANRLAQAERDAAGRERAVREAQEALDKAARRLRENEAESARRAIQVEQATAALNAARQDALQHAGTAGLDGALQPHPFAVPDPLGIASLAPEDFDSARAGLRALLAGRREQIALLRRRHAELAQARAEETQREQARQERRDEAEEAAAARAEADEAAEQAGRALLQAWEAHFASLAQLAPDAGPALQALADWVTAPEGDNPARLALLAAQQQALPRLAAERHALEMQGLVLREERQALDAERQRLAAGEDPAPPEPWTRGPGVRDARLGAPLWQLVEFREEVDAAQRAGLEAALEAAGLLDAWVAPDGALHAAGDGRPLHDTQWLSRPLQPGGSLADWLQPAGEPDAPVPSAVLARLLAGVACGARDPADAEAWVAPDGRFRLGALAGAWHKPAALHIGFAARAAARERRLTEIARRLEALAAEEQALRERLARQAEAERQADQEGRTAPGDEPLRQAHLSAAARERELQRARERLAQADAQRLDAARALEAAQQRLADDAADLRLPPPPESLSPIEAALQELDEALQSLVQAAWDLRLHQPEFQRQQAREAEARQDHAEAREALAAAAIEAEEARARLTALRETVGARVEELQQRIAGARASVGAAEREEKAAGEDRLEAARALAVAETRANGAAQTLEQRGAARAAEQALREVDADDASWERVQKHIGADLTELQGALTALGHQAHGEASDYGLVVRIVWRNRPERPDRLAARLADEIAQRRELLSAGEREVLENHLQAEIAIEVQRLLQAAERQVEAINRELHKRPTSTGVRFKLQWQPLPEGAEGAPVGLEAARRRLLNTGADLWSAEDRRVVGAMLQQRIAAERERSEGGSLLEQLARALDYRHWHEFRVLRWQDGQWRKLSGPASSGERALGLTVPLFAAVASFYSHGGYAHAPRLVLLDEAFAGIDDAARAHCMALIREFDLDFVITSEREWACYAELPGVSICQLQRREGIDAVFVSRWSWDGRARRREEDPDRRFAPGT